MSEEKPQLILCGKYDVKVTHTKGSVMTHCYKCDTPLWITPAGLQLIAETERKVEPVCYECIQIEITARGKDEITFAPPNREQEEEILKHMTREQMDACQRQIQAALNGDPVAKQYIEGAMNRDISREGSEEDDRLSRR